jgi:hypothetical protein
LEYFEDLVSTRNHPGSTFLRTTPCEPGEPSRRANTRQPVLRATHALRTSPESHLSHAAMRLRTLGSWWALPLLVLFLAHCGGEEICPQGTRGEQCASNADLGLQPQVPSNSDAISDMSGALASDSQINDHQFINFDVPDGLDSLPPDAVETNADNVEGDDPSDIAEQANASTDITSQVIRIRTQPSTTDGASPHLPTPRQPLVV